MLNSSSFPMIDGFAETMDLRKCASVANGRSVNVGMIDYVHKMNASGPVQEPEEPLESTADNVDIDLSEIYFLVMHFLSAGPCKKTFSQLRDELLEHELLPKRYHAWHSRSGAASNGGNSVGKSFPLSYDKLVERYSHIENDHLVQLLKQLMLMTSPPLRYIFGRDAPSASDVPTLLGTGSFSLLSGERGKVNNQLRNLPSHLRWPHKQANQVQGLRLREIGGGFSKHHRAPSMRLACYAIAKPSTVVPKLQNMKKLRGHRDAVYCAIFDHSGRYVITGSDDRLVKIWSMDTAFCLASCRGHEGDITDLSVSLNNATVASASNDYTIRVWRLPDGYPISVLRGHTGTVTAIAFSPRASTVYMLLSSSEDGTCRLWDARYSHLRPHIYLPKPTDTTAGICSGLPSAGASSSVVLPSHQILCCAFNASGTVFVTGSSDTFARVWSARRPSMDDPEQPSHEIDILAGHENDVNYVQFSGCSVASRFSPLDSSTEDSIPKFRNSGFNQDNIVTCSRDGTAIIWIPRSRRSHGKAGRWIRAYHLKVPPPPMPPQPPRGGPRQRLLPTPRGVNMIVWSLDNRFVLAAIMDNRICVWNANDGSLVHSLAGHTASTYVLDVHPFNPRIAMSAGYDGKAILWDIWEGTPIRVYEIGGRFKLVDGKFSQDGTSILLSDDVGQIYLLSTGEGESHKDAKYDQFFLGDYRPLAQDAYGNVVDQETQLVPHRRNLQDPLCDSSMLPYPEPYQSMYQKRRLGALGIEWSPSSIKFAVGTDIGIGQDFHILPLADLEGAFEPLPDYVDAVFWEPENDVINDDNDSEFNITEEYFSEEPTCDSDSTSSDSGSHEDNNKVRRSRRDNMHRPNKKKSLRDGEVTTSLGRRAKKRTSDEQEGSSSRQKRRKKIKPGQRASRKKFAKSKSLRSRRTAARNANNSFSQITEASADDEDVDFSSGETSETESSFEGSDSQEEGEDFCNSQKQPSAATGITLIGSQDVLKPNNNNPDSRPGDANRKKLVVKFSLHGRATPTFSENNDGQAKNPVNGAPSSIKGCENKQEGMFNPKAEDICSSSASLVDKEQSIFKQQPEDAEEATGGNELRTNTSCSDIRTSWGKLKMHISSDVRRDDVSPLDENTKRNDGSLPTGSDEMSSSLVISPITGHQLTNNDSVGLNKQKFEAVEDELPREPPPIAKKKLPVFKIKARKFLGESSPNLPSKTTSVKFPVEEKQTLGGSSVVSKYEPHYNGDEVYDSDSHVSLHDRETKGGSPERKTDSAHRARSLRLKITSPEIDCSNYKSETGALYLQPGTSKNLGRSFANALDHLPSERSTSAGRSRSSRSRRDDQYEKDDSPLVDGNIPQMSRKTNWLLLTKHEEGCRYIPQLGDEVVYLQQGHREYVERTSQTQPSTPRLRSGDKLRAAEVCLVEDLSYTTVPGSGESCCQILLKFIDNSCAVFGKSFKLSLPELADFPDFLVERTQYDAAIHKNWKVRDKCRVWWRNENGHGGDWWDGRIIAIKDESPDFPGSPWERFVVKYPNDTADYRHCPWELHDPERPWEHPNIDVESKTKLLDSLTTSKNKDRYGILKLNEVAEKLDFVNRFPVPLSPRIIISRLENDYYRSVMAVEHDIQVMSKNGESYFLKNTELRRKMIQLRQKLLSAL